jgi:hypothetical protein
MVADAGAKKLSKLGLKLDSSVLGNEAKGVTTDAYRLNHATLPR